MKNLLMVLCFVGSLANAQVSQRYASRIYRVGDQVIITDSAGVVRSSYPYQLVKMDATNSLVRVNIEGLSKYYQPAKILNSSGVAYSTTSAMLALSGILATVPIVDNSAISAINTRTSNVDNTPDNAKPVSGPQQTALDTKPVYVTDIASLTALSRGNVTSVIVGGAQGGTFTYDATLSSFDYGTTFPASGGGGYRRVFSGTPNVAFWSGASGIKVSTGSISGGSAVLTSANAIFSSSLVGKKIMLAGAGTSSKPLCSTITSFQSATQVTLATAASNTVSNVHLTYGGVDETAYFQAAIDYLIANNGGELLVKDAHWIEGTVYINPAKQIPISIVGATENPRLDGFGYSAGATTLLRTTTGDIFRVNMDASGNNALGGTNGYQGFGIKNIAFVNKSDVTGITCLNVFRTRANYKNLFFSKVDYGIYQANADASGNLNYCDLSTYANIHVANSRYSGLLLSRADASTITGLYFEAPQATAKFALEVENTTGLDVNGVLQYSNTSHTTITGGSFIRLNTCFSVSVKNLHLERTQFEATFSLVNSGAISVDGIYSFISSVNTFYVQSVRGLRINNWYTVEDKTGGYDIYFQSGYTNSDIVWNNAELQDNSSVSRDIILFNSLGRGIIAEMPLEKSTDLNNHLGFKLLKTKSGASNLPPNASFASGFQVMINDDANSIVQLVSDGFRWWKHYKSGGSWNSWFAMMDGQNMNTVTTITDGPSVAIDAVAGYNYVYKWTLGANRAIPLLFNPTNGQRVLYRLKQDATGGRTVTWNAIYQFPAGKVPYLSTSANAVDYLGFAYNSTDVKWELISFVRYDDGLNSSGSATYAPGTIAAGTEVSTTVTVTGATLGQFARASFTNSLAGCVITAYISAANTVTVVFRNNTGSGVALTSGTLSVRVD